MNFIITYPILKNKQAKEPIMNNQNFLNSLNFLNLFPEAGNEGKFPVNIKNHGDGYQIEAHLPGFEKEEIDLEINENILTIKASKKEENKLDETNYVRLEVFNQNLVRSFKLENLNTTEVTAGMKNGILTVELKKLKENKQKIVVN